MFQLHKTACAPRRQLKQKGITGRGSGTGTLSIPSPLHNQTEKLFKIKSECSYSPNIIYS